MGSTNGPKCNWGFSCFWPFILYILIFFFGWKWVIFHQIAHNDPQWYIFSYAMSWCLLSTILMNINASGWAQMVKMHFLDFLVFLQKTLSANISAPRRGREAIQYSKSSSGCPLCSQTSSTTWGSILRALEPQT